MAITDPARLPGAFLFFTIKTPTGSFASVAYDEKITKTTKLQDLQQRYLSGNGAKLPYMERFAPITSEGVSTWQGKDNVTYGKYSSQILRLRSLRTNAFAKGGVFGGPDPATTGTSTTEPPKLYRSAISPKWPYSQVEDSPVRNGVYVSYWNFATGSSKGMHTSSVSRHFAKGAEVPYMWLYPGNSTNLVPKDAPFVQAVVSEVYLNWYATLDGDLKWNQETISRDI